MEEAELLSGELIWEEVNRYKRKERGLGVRPEFAGHHWVVFGNIHVGLSGVKGFPLSGRLVVTAITNGASRFLYCGVCRMDDQSTAFPFCDVFFSGSFLGWPHIVKGVNRWYGLFKSFLD